ncbi:hypothetical protein ACFLZX_04995 [Nanoarchaeota archaeon]
MFKKAIAKIGFDPGISLTLLPGPHSFIYLENTDEPTRVIKGYFDWPPSAPKSAKSRFEREVASLEFLADHPNTPKLLDKGVIGNTARSMGYFQEMITPNPEEIPYMIIDYYKGDNLFSNLPIWCNNLHESSFQFRTGNFNPFIFVDPEVSPHSYFQAAIQLIDLVGIVASFHDVGVTQGDLKPQNLLHRSLDLRVLDFELSEIEGHNYDTGPHPHGTLAYRDPSLRELPRNQTYDLFSLGCLIQDLFPFRITTAPKEEFVLECYLTVDPMSWQAEFNHVSHNGVKAMSDPDKFYQEMKEDPKIADRLLREFIEYTHSRVHVIQPRPYNTTFMRELRAYEFEFLQGNPYLTSLFEVLPLRQVAEMQELGRALLHQNPDKRPSASEVYERLKPLRYQFQQMLKN